MFGVNQQWADINQADDPLDITAGTCNDAPDMPSILINDMDMSSRNFSLRVCPRRMVSWQTPKGWGVIPLRVLVTMVTPPSFQPSPSSLTDTLSYRVAVVRRGSLDPTLIAASIWLQSVKIGNDLVIPFYDASGLITPSPTMQIRAFTSMARNGNITSSQVSTMDKYHLMNSFCFLDTHSSLFEYPIAIQQATSFSSEGVTILPSLYTLFPTSSIVPYPRQSLANIVVSFGSGSYRYSYRATVIPSPSYGIPLPPCDDRHSTLVALAVSLACVASILLLLLLKMLKNTHDAEKRGAALHAANTNYDAIQVS
jgi:hypothetical protein